jgi:hypothetical protein
MNYFPLQFCATSGNSLGYGFSRIMSNQSKSKSKSLTPDNEGDTVDGALAI